MSNRSDKKFLKEKEAKEVRRLYTELNNCREAIYKSPMVTLSSPRFIGFKRFFVLREDIARRKDAKEIQQILDLISTTTTSKTKDFSKFDAEDKWGRTPQRLRRLSVKQYEKLIPLQQKMFSKYWSARYKCYRYKFDFPWMFVYKIKRNYVTEVPMLLPNIESRIKQLDTKLWDSGSIQGKLFKSMGWSNHMDEWDLSYTKKSIVEKIMDDFMNEEIFKDED